MCVFWKILVQSFFFNGRCTRRIPCKNFQVQEEGTTKIASIRCTQYIFSLEIFLMSHASLQEGGRKGDSLPAIQHVFKETHSIQGHGLFQPRFFSVNQKLTTEFLCQQHRKSKEAKVSIVVTLYIIIITYYHSVTKLKVQFVYGSLCNALKFKCFYRKV